MAIQCSDTVEVALLEPCRDTVPKGVEGVHENFELTHMKLNLIDPSDLVDALFQLVPLRLEATWLEPARLEHPLPAWLEHPLPALKPTWSRVDLSYPTSDSCQPMLS